ncbi:hypothetical protein Tco_1120007, partial [Tanacetum coccineum]
MKRGIHLMMKIMPPNSPNSSNTIIDESGNATSMGDKSISKGNSQHTKNVLIFFDQNNVGYDIPSNISTENNKGMQPAGNRRSTRTMRECSLL